MAKGDKGYFYEELASQGDWDSETNPYETQRRLDLLFGDLLAGVELQGALCLDGGSGGGHFSAAAAARGARVVSCDVGTSLLGQVGARCESHRTCGSIEDLPFDSGRFDVVFSTEVIEHTREPLRAVGELARVLAPGGTIAITTPGKIWQPVVRAATTLKLRPYEGYEHFVWLRALRRALEEAGIEIEQVRGFNLLPLFQPRLEPFHRAADRLGAYVPSLYVNVALLGHRP